MERSLTAEQQKVFSIADAGHNVFIAGQAGSGKSYVVNCIVKSLIKRGRRVIVVSSSAISCSVYDTVRSRTLHSQYALFTANMPSSSVIEKSLSTRHCMEQIQKAETIVWDEAGMSSQRTLELVNAIHQRLDREQSGCKCASGKCLCLWKPFGGKQLILVGEFVQLRPVPSIFDDGEMMFLSNVFKTAITHRFELKQLMRQASASEVFVKSISQVRLGYCDRECEGFLRSLSRPLSDSYDPIHIYFDKQSVKLHNLDVLFKLPGDALRFECVDEGDVVGISCPAEKVLLLKGGAKVMVVWNLSDDVKNGSMGVFVGLSTDEMLEVKIAGGDTVFLKKQVWSKCDRTGRIVGTRTQFPLVLSYASTCHKLQGLTLESAVLHCTNEFVSGLTYVALSRVRKEEDLQVIAFKASQLLKPSQEVLAVCRESKEEVEGYMCCRNQEISESFFVVGDKGHLIEGDTDAPESLTMDSYPDGLVSSFFERDSDVVMVHLESIYGMISENESCFAQPPSKVVSEELLKTLFMPEPLQSDFARDNNYSLTLIQSRLDSFHMFVGVQWRKIFELFVDHLVDNDNIDNIFINRKEFTEANRQLHNRIIDTDDLRLEACSMFGVQKLTEAQISLSSELCRTFFEMLIHKVATFVVREHNTEQVQFEVDEMPPEGQAKIRHVGGWAIRKELEEARSKVRENIHSMNRQTRKKVMDAHAKCQLLEEFAIVQYSSLRDTTQYPQTLEVTEDRQYRERGLIHISDSMFKFFLKLESLRVNNLNIQRLREACDKSAIVDVTLEAISQNDELLNKWNFIFEGAAVDKKVLVNEMCLSVIKRYVTMGAAQFLKDFRRAFHLKKSAEHRKRVLQRQEQAAVRKDGVPFSRIMADKSPGKRNSHCQLVTFVNKHGIDGVQKFYKKSELVKLCIAYGVRRVREKELNSVLADLLVGVIKSCQQDYIPCHLALNTTLQSSTDTTGGSVRLRIRCV